MNNNNSSKLAQESQEQQFLNYYLKYNDFITSKNKRRK
jgi:hypothetical protein